MRARTHTIICGRVLFCLSRTCCKKMSYESLKHVKRRPFNRFQFTSGSFTHIKISHNQCYIACCVDDSSVLFFIFISLPIRLAKQATLDFFLVLMIFRFSFASNNFYFHSNWHVSYGCYSHYTLVYAYFKGFNQSNAHILSAISIYIDFHFG